MNENTNQNQTQPKPRNPYTLWFVVLSFVAPVVLAYLVFYFVDVKSFNNNGELLKPMIQVADLKLKNEAGELIEVKELTYKWRFISFLNSHCDAACSERLIEARQIHKALGKNQHRVYQVLVLLAEPDQQLKTFIDNELPEAIVLRGDASTIAPLLPVTTSGSADNQIYIQDPMGNIMMRFNQDQPIDELHYDVKKLLKASQIG